MEKNRRKSGGKNQVEKLQSIRLEWYGGRCMDVDEKGIQCNCTFDLELAHAKSTALSIKKSSARSSWERLKDVMENPECFLLFCTKHHFAFDGKDSIIWYSDYYSRNEV